MIRKIYSFKTHLCVKIENFFALYTTITILNFWELGTKPFSTSGKCRFPNGSQALLFWEPWEPAKLNDFPVLILVSLRSGATALGLAEILVIGQQQSTRRNM